MSKYEKVVKNTVFFNLTLTFDLEDDLSWSNQNHHWNGHMLFIWITYFVCLNTISGLIVIGISTNMVIVHKME